MKKILVIGSSNTDMIVTVKDFPVAGETVEGTSFFQAMGGKGANQALAAHRLGGNVTFVTALGNDANGANTLKYYREEGLDVTALKVEEVPSGTAMIWVNETGENCIVITPGANNRLSPAYIHDIREVIEKADIVVMQMEIPYETVRTVCHIARELQKRIILNVAPARAVERELLREVDILVVNEVEAAIISGEKMEAIGVEAVMDRLLEMGTQSVLLTLGRRGSRYKSKEEAISTEAFMVTAVDTTAAGDTFCGAIAAEMARGKTWNEALRFASAASAICVTRMGAQPSIPTEKEVRNFLKQHETNL